MPQMIVGVLCETLPGMMSRNFGRLDIQRLTSKAQVFQS